MINFICKPCKTGADVVAADSPALKVIKADLHSHCRGATWCDCQHRENK
jgi:hypothetical protein